MRPPYVPAALAEWQCMRARVAVIFDFLHADSGRDAIPLLTSGLAERRIRNEDRAYPVMD